MKIILAKIGSVFGWLFELKILEISSKKDASALIGITGVANAVVEKISPAGDLEKSFLIFDGLQNPTQELLLMTNQLELDEVLSHSKESHLKSTLKNSILRGNLLAEQIANTVMDASDLENMLEVNQDEFSVRGVIANASKPKMSIHIEGEQALSTGGGLAVPKQLAKGKSVSFTGCTVVDVSRRGWVKILKPATSELGYAEAIIFYVNRKSKDFNLLNAARIFDCLIDCQLIKFEKVSNAKERFELLTISNQNELLGNLIEKLKVWGDMS